MEETEKKPETQQAAPAVAKKVAPKKRRRVVKRKKVVAKAAPPVTGLPIKQQQAQIDDEATDSWRPARITDIPESMKRPDREYHFFLDNPNSIRKRQMERWHIDTEIAGLMAATYGARTLAQGTTLDGCYRVNELILMWMPKTVAASRTKYFQDMARMETGTMKRIMKQEVQQNSPDSRETEMQVYTRNPMAPNAPDMNKVDRISAADLPA